MRSAAPTQKGAQKGGVRTRIRVIVRVRPTIQEDIDSLVEASAEQYSECVEEDPARATVQLKKPYFDTREFSLDCVLGREATQAQTYEAVGRPVVDDVLEGFNGTVLAYGQTGTGKTYTIYGPLSYWRRAPVAYGVGGGLGRVAPQQAAPQLPMQPQLELSGVVTRAAMQIFAHQEELRRRGDGTKFRVLISSLQIWQEAISDLLGERRSSGPLTVREDPERGVYAEGLSEHEVSGADGVLALVHESATNRATCSTSMNRSSSRSHALLLIRVEQWTPPPEETANGDDGPGRHANGDDRSSIASSLTPKLAVRRGLLSIVDLAGSERVCKSGSDGVRLEEAKRINKSISALGNCIAALANSGSTGRAAAHVPYRDSKLTRLLTDSLGGNTKTTLCASIGPSLGNYDETFCTLLLATRAMAIKVLVRVNERIEKESGGGGPERLALLSRVRELQSEVLRLRKESSASNGNGQVSSHHAATRVRPPPHHPKSTNGHTGGGGGYGSVPRTPPTWAQPQGEAPPTWAGGAAYGTFGAPPASAGAVTHVDAYGQAHPVPSTHPAMPPNPGSHAGGNPESGCDYHNAYTGLAGLGGLQQPLARGGLLPSGQMPALNTTLNGTSDDAVAASAACTAALAASARMHVPTHATTQEAAALGHAPPHALPPAGPVGPVGPGMAPVGHPIGVAEWGQVVWNFEAMNLSDATRRHLPPPPPPGTAYGADGMAAADGVGGGGAMGAAASSGALGSQMQTPVATPKAAQPGGQPPRHTANGGGPGASSALKARLAQRGGSSALPSARAGAVDVTDGGVGGGGGGSQVRGTREDYAGAHGAALAASTAAGLISTEPTPHPSPSELPVPSQLTLAAGEASRDHLQPSDLQTLGHLQQAALLSQGAMDAEGGDVVLDQLVSGLLATPCIRRRLDRLYGKASYPRPSVSDERLDQLTALMAPQAVSVPGSTHGSSQPSSRTGSQPVSQPVSPGLFNVTLPPPPQSPQHF